MTRPPQLHADRARIAAQQDRAFELRLQGATFRDVARDLGVSVATAHARLEAACRELVDPKVEMWRVINLERLEEVFCEARRLHDRHFPDALAGSEKAETVVHLTANRMLRTLDQENRMLALYDIPPARPQAPNAVVDADLMRLLEDMRQRNRATEAELKAAAS